MNIPTQAIEWWIAVNAPAYPYSKLSNNIHIYNTGKTLRLTGWMLLLVAALASYEMATESVSTSYGSITIISFGLFILFRKILKLSVNQSMMVETFITDYSALVKLCRQRGKRLETAWEPYNNSISVNRNVVVTADKSNRPEDSACAHYGWLVMKRIAKEETLLDAEIKFAEKGTSQHISSPEKEELREKLRTSIEVMRKFGLVKQSNHEIKHICFSTTEETPSLIK